MKSDDTNSNNTMLIGFFTEYLYTPGEMLNETLNHLIEDGIFLEKLSTSHTLSCDTDLCSLSEEMMVLRDQWNAEPPKFESKKLSIPASKVIITDTTHLGMGDCETKVSNALKCMRNVT